MFALRSSPSSLVCDLRNTLLPAAEGGFQLSAPRPRRATVRLGFDIYYAGADSHPHGEADSGLDGGGGGGSAFSPAVSDFAGVFEAGDPARARESMNNNFVGERPSGLVEERAPREDDIYLGGNNNNNGNRDGGLGGGEHGAMAGDGAAGPVAVDDDDGEGSVEGDDGGLEEDFLLFEMEGLKEDRQQERGMRAAPNGGGDGGRTGSEGWGASAIAGAAAAAAASERGAGGRRGEVGAAPPRIFHGTRTYASSPSPSSPSGEGGTNKVAATGAAGVGGGTTLRKPRVIAPRGTRCIGGGMYRLRLSTSC